jgi:hypothetical protein
MNSSLNSDILEWLRQIAETEILPAGIVAFNVGLFETQEGFEAYLAGASRYDAADDSWAEEECFVPQGRYLPLPSSRYGFESWETAQAAVISAVRGALASPALQRSFLSKVSAVTVGFDDGDLQRVA